MEEFTIENAFELREEIVNILGKDNPNLRTISNILYGYYDGVKNKKEVAYQDLQILLEFIERRE